MRGALIFIGAMVAALDFEPCAEDVKAHLHISHVSLVPERLLPGEKLCVHFEAKSDAPLRRGAHVRIELPSLSVPGIQYDLCSAAKLDCPTAGNVSGTVCDAVPLSAMLMADQRVPFVLRAVDEAGAPLACLQSAAIVADAVAVDADVEETIDKEVHYPLRRALLTAEGARSGAVTAEWEEAASGVRKMLSEAYAAAPEWADAYTRWREAHGKAPRRHAEQQSPDEEARAVLAEARSFAQFRQNVLTAVRYDRSLKIDSRADMLPDHRRTLEHFS